MFNSLRGTLSGSLADWIREFLMVKGLQANWRRWLAKPYLSYAILGLLGLALAVVGFVRVLPSLVRVPDHYDFAAYYVAARALNQHETLYDGAAMQRAATIDGQHMAHPLYIYPPFFAAVLRPLASLPFGQAKTIWFLGNIGLFGAMWWLLGHLAQLSWQQRLFGLAGLMLAPPFYDTLLLGQVNMLLLALLTCALALMLRAKPSSSSDLLAGALIGIAAVIKVYPLAFGLIFLLHRRYVASLGVLLGVAGTMLFGILAGGGLDTTLRFFSEVLPSLRGPANAADQSIWPVFERIFTEHQYRYAYLSASNLVELTLKPVIEAPLLGKILAASVAAVIGLLSGRSILRRWRSPSTNERLWFDYGLIIMLTLLLLPVVHSHYFVLLLIPLAWLLQRYQQLAPNQKPYLIIGLLASYGLIVLERYWRFLLNLAATPLFLGWGLVGALILWWLLIRYQPTNATIED